MLADDDASARRHFVIFAGARNRAGRIARRPRRLLQNDMPGHRDILAVLFARLTSADASTRFLISALAFNTAWRAFSDSAY